MKEEAIFLHRKNKPTWGFKHDRIFGWAHRTKYGNTYSIFQGLSIDKPFWIGRAFFKSDKEPHWMDAAMKIRSSWLDFPDGSEYYFPGSRF